MDSDDKYFYNNFMDSFLSNEEDETAMMQEVLADVERAEEHVQNFKGSIKGHRMLNRKRAREHLTLMDDYFVLNALLTDNFLPTLSDADFFYRLYNGFRTYDDYFILMKKGVVEKIGLSS